MYKNFYLLSFLWLNIFSLQAIDKESVPVKRNCGTDIPSLQWQQDFKRLVQQFVAQQNNAQNRINAAYTLPVIVHVVYWNSSENISAAQINSQIDVLNADFAGTGLNANTCPSVFQSLISNTNISFCKAAKDPNGNTLAEPGIERINAQTEGFTNPTPSDGWSKSYITSTIKPATYWDPTKYLNIWVLPLGGGLLGYATFPGGPSNIDGVVIGHTYYGTTGLVSAPYNKGRTTTHEIGHWLGLYHISGDEECGDDECADTPPQRGNAGDGQGLNYGCPTFPHLPNSCTGTGANGELFMNFMDYTDDACMYLFTPDQRDRMQTVMSTVSMRTQLAASSACNVTPQPPVANFSADRTNICPGNTVNFTDLSTNVPTSWSWSISPASGWTFTGGTNASSRNPKVIFNTLGNYSITLTASNTLGSDGETKSNYIVVANPSGLSLPFTEGFQNTTFPPSGWSLNNTSSFSWERSTAAGGFGTSNASMYFNNFDDDAGGNKDDILSPILNLNGATNPRLRFDVAYAPYLRSNGSSKFDTLEVLITDYCNNTSTSIYKKGGTQLLTAAATSLAFVPSSSQWRKDSVNIPAAYLNKNVKITFRNYGLYANNIYVDNINLYSTGSSSCTGTPTSNFTSSATTVCAGSSITFTNTSTASSGAVDSVRWIISGGTPSTSTSTSTVTAAFNTAGTFTVTLNAYKCGTLNAKSQTINVNARPNVTVTSPSICSGQTAQPIASGATTYTWSGGLAAVSNPLTPVLTTTTTYTVTGTTNACTNTAVSTVTVTALPNVSVTSATICSGNTATIQASGATTYTWSGGLGTGNPKTTPVLTTTTTYTVTGTSGTCSKTAVSTVTVTPLPNVSVTSATICSGNTAIIQASGATSYSWSGGLGTGNPKTTPVLTTTTTYTVTGTTGSCSKTAVSTVTVTPLPNVTVTSPSICGGGTATIQASGATTYTWTGGLTGNPATTPPLTATTTYTVTGTTGSCSKTAISTVSVNNAAPTISITAVPSASICTGSSVTLQANGANNYTWSSSQTGTTSGASLTFVPNSNITVSLTGNLIGCTSFSTVSIDLVLKPKPTVLVTSPSICPGQTAQPVASGANTYTWTNGLSAIANPITPVLTTTTSYTVTGTASNACTNTAVSTVSVKTVPTTPVITQSRDTLYSSIIIAGATYEWYKGGVLQVSNSSPFFKISSSGVYTLKIINNGCSSALSANFNATLTGIRMNKLEIQYTIAPNPNNGVFDLNILSSENKTYQLRLFSVGGQEIISEQMNLRVGQNYRRFDIAGIEKGVYFLSIIGNEGVNTQSILIQ